MDEQVDDPFEMGKYRDAGLALHPRDQIPAASRHDDIEVAVQPGQHCANGSSITGRHQTDGVRRQAHLVEAPPQGVGDRARRPIAVRSRS
jgi:hypothetical protein